MLQGASCWKLLGTWWRLLRRLSCILPRFILRGSFYSSTNRKYLQALEQQRFLSSVCLFFRSMVVVFFGGGGLQSLEHSIFWVCCLLGPRLSIRLFNGGTIEDDFPCFLEHNFPSPMEFRTPAGKPEEAPVRFAPQSLAGRRWDVTIPTVCCAGRQLKLSRGRW